MVDFNQTKTSQGYLPFRSVELVEGAATNECEESAVKEPAGEQSAGERSACAALSAERSMAKNEGESVTEQSSGEAPFLVFDLYMPTELEDCPEASVPRHDERHADLIKLAACVQPAADDPTQLAANKQGMFELAQTTGPLFGGAAVENLRDWGLAATSALLAVRLQEYLNGGSSIEKLASLGFIRKCVASVEGATASGENEEQFVFYSVGLVLSSAYRSVVKQLPLIRRIQSEDGFYYAFVTEQGATEQGMAEQGSLADSCGGEAPLGVAQFDIFAFEHELTIDDFEEIRRVLDLDAKEQELARTQLKPRGMETSRYHIADDLRLTTEELPLSDADRGALEAIVQALVVCHLSSAYVDVFQGSSATGFLSFGNYLSWLWFDFSCKLGTVKLGYCSQCGRPFSLAGQRGKPKVYCSAACKTAAKNERSRYERDRARELFLNQGKSVAEIALELDLAKPKVRGHLVGWTALKHALDDDIEQHGFKESPLLARCHNEGLNPVKNLLNAKRLNELKAHSR